jgi:hypothetical protein
MEDVVGQQKHMEKLRQQRKAANSSKPVASSLVGRHKSLRYNCSGHKLQL